MFSPEFHRSLFSNVRAIPSFLPPAYVPLTVLAIALVVCLATPYTLFFCGGLWSYGSSTGYGWPWCFCVVSSETACVKFNGWGSELEYATRHDLTFAVYWWSDLLPFAFGSAFFLGILLADALVWLAIAALAHVLARAALTHGKRLLARLVPAKLLGQHATEFGRVDLA